jgi:WXXGXW repeat (2 copies)
MMKRTLYTALAAAAISTPALLAPAMFSPAAAQASMNIGLTVGTPPPAPVYEVVPAPRAGYVWAPGFWQWEGSRHTWHAGYWMPERRGYNWVPDRWEQAHGGWRHEPGHWDRQVANRPWGDRDHDGVPNAYDRHPDNPYRR